MKEFIFIMQLLLPGGGGPEPHREQVPSLVECLSKSAEMQSKNEAGNGDFVFVTSCVQLSKKADPA